METKDNILNILKSADKQLLEKEYIKAFYEYEQIFPILSSLHIKSRRADAVGSFAGWTAGFITGGLGLEDLILIFFISKNVSTVLGVKHDATKEEIKKAYYEKMKQYHPDNFAHLSKEFQEIANKKVQKINEAYMELMKGE